MHRMWNNAPMLVLLAQDAGDALQRQIRQALEQRERSGAQARLVQALASSELGELFGRASLAVVAMDRTSQAEALVKNCAWLQRVKDFGEKEQ